LPTPIPGALTADTIRLTAGDYEDYVSTKDNFTPYTRESVYDRAVNEIAIARLTAGDQLFIETEHSIYLFTITDPNNDTGSLIGGLLGNYATKASLLALSTDSNLSIRKCKGFRTGARARFLIDSDSGARCLLTSTITKLVHRKAKG
jgi:hypothetical protein